MLKHLLKSHTTVCQNNSQYVVFKANKGRAVHV